DQPRRAAHRPGRGRCRSLDSARRRRDQRGDDRSRREEPMTKRIEFYNPPTLTRAVGYAHGAETRGGRLLFVAGQVAKDKEGRVGGSGDLVAQLRPGCENRLGVLPAT